MKSQKGEAIKGKKDKKEKGIKRKNRSEWRKDKKVRSYKKG